MSKYFQKIICLIILLRLFMNFASAHLPLITSEKGMTSPMIASGVYLDIINNLSDHINEEIVLTDSDFVNNHDLLIQYMEVLSTDMEAISKSFEL